MKGKRIIVLNGQHYDATTGLAVSAAAHSQKISVKDASFTKPTSSFADVTARSTTPAAAKMPRPHHPATSIHGKPQRSQTLRRSAVKKPASAIPVQNSRERAQVSRSPHITRFAQHPQPIQRKVDVALTPAAPSPTYHSRHAERQQPITTKQISSRTIKEHLITQQLAAAPAPAHHQEAVKKPRNRHFSLATAGIALILLGGYLTYLNMPSLSIRVAAAQAGIDASLPEYHPDGYRFNGPVAYSQGEVDMTFAANAGPQSYHITQKASDWDSQAVLDNYVMSESNGQYNIHSTQGLTVYTYDNKAVWVNNGILHVVDYDNAPLSYGQIERIAASM